MNISTTFIQIAILFFPGIITVAILQLLKTKNKIYSNLEIFFYSFVYGMTINLIIYGLIFHRTMPLLQFIMGGTINITEFELLVGIIVAIIFGLISSYYRNLGLINSKAIDYDLSYETGFSTILDYILNSPEELSEELKVKKVQIIIFYNGKNIKLTPGLIKILEIHEDYVEILLEDEEKEHIYYQLKKGEFSLKFLPSFSSENVSKKKKSKYVQDQKRKIPKLLIILIVSISVWQVIYFYKNYDLKLYLKSRDKNYYYYIIDNIKR